MKEKKRKVGRLITNNVIMEAHEYRTINVLLANGEDVEMLPKSRTPHSKSADIFMRGLVWEMKSPTGKTERSIERILHRALHQSENIIVDLRRAKISRRVAILTLERFFYKMRSMRNLWIIMKASEIIKYKK